VCDGYKLDQYLVMLDERVHSTEGRLEGREPIGGLFRDVEQDLRGIDNSLPLCCEIRTVKRVYSAEGAGQAHVDSDRRYFQRPRDSSDVGFETWFCLE